MSDLPVGWDRANFGDLFSLVSINQKKLPRKSYLEVGRFQVIDQGQLEVGGYSDDESKVVDSELPLIVFGDHTRCMKFVTSPFVPGADGIKVLKPLTVNRKWFYYAGLSLKYPDKGYARHFKHLKAARVGIPPLNEQKRIVTKLEACETQIGAAREALDDVPALLEQYRQSVLAAAFRGDLTRDWRKANPDVEPASELLARLRTERRQRWEEAERAKYEAKGKTPPKGWEKRYNEPEHLTEDTINELPKLPSTWRWGAVGQLAELITKGQSPKWQGFDYKSEGALFIRSQNIRWGDLDLSDQKFVDFGFQEKHKSAVIKSNDILLNLVGASVGRSALATLDVDGASLNQAVAIIRLLSDLNRSFFSKVFLSPWIQDHIHGNKSDVARANFNLDDIRIMPIPIPPIKEQTQIFERVSVLSDVISKLEKHANRSSKDLTTLTQSLLAKAFRGELVPQDPTDEPASELLARIRAQRETEAATKKSSKKKTVRKKAAAKKRSVRKTEPNPVQDELF